MVLKAFCQTIYLFIVYISLFSDPDCVLLLLLFGFKHCDKSFNK